MLRGAALGVLLAVGFTWAFLADASPRATCTAAQKAQRQAAVSAYRKKIPAQRAAYFRTHRSAKARAAFVKKQRAALKALQAKARCRVPRPAPPTTTQAAPPPPPPLPPPPPAGSNCFVSPGACGFPDPAYRNVGVPAGTTLSPSGSITVSTDGTVINGLDVSGTISVNARNVTIQNTRVTAAGTGCGLTATCGNFAILVGCACTVTISNVELTANAPTTVEHGIRNANGGMINVDHVYQHGNIDALCWCGNASVRDSYSIIHLAISTDHLENLYTDDATLTAIHNTLPEHRHRRPPTSSRIPATAPAAACRNQLTITDNLFAGGGFTLYPCGNATSVGTSRMDVERNRFARCKTPQRQGGGGTWLCTGGPDSFGYYPRRRLVRLPRGCVLPDPRADLDRERLGRQQRDNPLLI